MMDSTGLLQFWPVLLYAAIVMVLIGGMLTLSYFLGQHHHDRFTNEVYESGVDITGSARLRFPAHYYIIAMFFVIFDLEAAFIITWSLAFKSLGWAGYAGVAIFILVLVAVLIYEWRIGALDYGPDGKKLIKMMKRGNYKNTNV